MESQFVQRLRELIGEGSERKFAQNAGISDSTLRSILKGTRPSIDLVVSIADANEVSVDWLVGRELLIEAKAMRPEGEASQTPPWALEEWLMEELGKIVLKAHKEAGLTLPSVKIAPEASVLYNELRSMVRDTSDRRVVARILPLLEDNLSERLKMIPSQLGTGKREAS